MKKYYFYKNPLFKVYAIIENGFVKMKTEGIASGVLKRTVKDLLCMFDGTKPSKITDDQLIYSTWMPPVPSKPFDRLVSSQMGNIRGKYIPEQLTISITEECPNKCIHCALPDTKNRAKLKLNEVKSIIKQSQEMGSTLIIFDGGEPLVYQGLEELISYVNQDLAIPALFTSGVGLTQERALALKQAGLYMLSVSFDSAHAEEHDHIRGRAGIFEEAVNAVNYGLQVGLLVNMYVVLSPANIYDLDDFYKFATDLGVHEISFFEIVPTGRWLKNTDVVLSKEQRKIFDDFVLQHKYDVSGPRIFPIPHIEEQMGCFAGKKWLHITPEGNVWACSCLPFIYGNIHDDSLRSIWEKITSDKSLNGNACLMRDPEFRLQKLGIK